MKQQDVKSNQTTVIHLISHNHWDREWIFTAQYANRWLVPFFETLFQMLQKQPNYRFVLDGQMLMIEDYLNQLSGEEAKTKEQAIRKYVEEGRLMVGPAYIQPDWSLVSGEALVRNLLIGHRMATQFGQVMQVAWMLDNFGQIAQAPQICRGFDINGVFIWRGPELPPAELKTEFWWEAPDGSQVLAIYLINSYRNAMVLSMSQEIARERILSQAKVLRPLASTPNVLLMNGYEQVPWPDDVLPIIEKVNRELGEAVKCVQSTPPEYLKAVRSFNPRLPKLQGYLYSGKYVPILKGVYSSRMPLKLQNHACQQELERWVEPFATFAWALGAEYPQAKLEKAWKTLLLNHTHDDICGCCVDPIARDMKARFKEVKKIASELTEESLRIIAQSIDTSRVECAVALVIFNPSCWRRQDLVGLSIEIPAEIKTFFIMDSRGAVIPYQLLRREESRAEIYLMAEDIPALGYKTYYLVPGSKDAGSYPKVNATVNDNLLENDYLRVEINDDGSLTVTNKNTGHVYENLGYFENGGDSGDTYDYSYPPKDKIITSLGQKAKIILEEAGPLVARFRVELYLNLPKSLTEDRKARSRKTRVFPIVSYVELAANSRQVEVTTIVNNVIKDHRLRVCFPTSIKAAYSYAEEPFDIARFSVEPESVPEELPAKVRELMLAGRYTVPVNTHIFQNFVGMADEDKGLTIISRGLTEYEILSKKNTIALTLLRAVGWLARPDLLTREGDVGPHIFTPEAQCLGVHIFYYAICPHRGDWLTSKPHAEAETHNLKFRAVQTDVHSGKLPDQSSFLSWTVENPSRAFKMTAIKRSEASDGVVIRFYNTLDQKAQGVLKIWDYVEKVFKINLNEEDKEEVAIKDGTVKVDARGKEIVTIKLKLQPKLLIGACTSDSTNVLLPCFFETKLPEVECPPVITEEEVRTELERVRKLKATLIKTKKSTILLENEMNQKSTQDLARLAQLQKMKTEVASLTRQLYESRISSLLNQQLLNGNNIESELEEIGEEYCLARTKKRVSEYLSNYYDNLLR